MGAAMGVLRKASYGNLVRVSVAMIKYHGQKQFAEERVYLAYSQSIIKGYQGRRNISTGTQRQELNEILWQNTVYWLSPIAFSA